MSIYANVDDLAKLSRRLGVGTEVYEAAVSAAMEAQATLCVRALINNHPLTDIHAPVVSDDEDGILARFYGSGPTPGELLECDPDGEL